MSMLPNIKLFPKLYGVSSKGVTKVWEISVFPTSGLTLNGNATILIQHGQLGGKIQDSPEVLREGKNIGKANETTAYEQALLEAESKWKKQHDKNYTEHLPTIDSGMGKITLKLLPMLAQKYKERAKHIVWPAFAQPKLNGVRCLVQRIGNKVFFWSRKAKQYKNFSLYMEQEFLSFMRSGEILDGEMYNHGDLTFQELVGLIKDEKHPDLDSLKKYVKFWCYDRPFGPEGFKDRYIRDRYNFPNGLQYLRLVDTHSVKNDADVNEFHGKFVADGYEGSIIRSGGDEPYNFQYRDNQLQKKKDFIDAEFVIVGCKQGTGIAEGHATFRCKTEFDKGGSYGDGTFDATCKTTHKKRKEQWDARAEWMGKELTVRYQCLSDDGIPIFPVGIIERDYE